ncbi:GNAT family N-acetyltransferase [soil metagenome]
MAIQLRPIDSDNIASVVRIRVTEAQELFVAPVVNSLAEAYVNQATAWPRAVFSDDVAVAFVMGSFDPKAEPDFFLCGIWRLNVDVEHQGKGFGRFAVESVFDEARRRDQARATVLWVPGDGGPEGFWLSMGFEPTGEEFYGQTVGEIFL